MKNRIVCLITCCLLILGALPAIGLAQSMQLERLRLSLYVYKTLNYPDSSSTWAYGIDGNNVVGYYEDASGKGHGFLYNGFTYKTLDVPDAIMTSTEGVNGTNIVGWYVDSNRKVHGFLYNGATYQTIDVPGALHTYTTGISGTNIVGWYVDASENQDAHGFFYNGSSYKILDPPGSTWTRINGISGTLIVGFYTTGEGYSYGCIYDISPNPYFPPPNFIKSLRFPGSDTTHAYGIYENGIVGQYMDASHELHGFYYNNATSTYTTVDKPNAQRTFPIGIYGGKIVGSYTDTGTWSKWFGFIRYLNPIITGKPMGVLPPWQQIP